MPSISVLDFDFYPAVQNLERNPPKVFDSNVHPSSFRCCMGI